MKFREAHKAIKSICCYKGEASEKDCSYLFCDLHDKEYLGNHNGNHVCLACTLDDSVGKLDRFLTEATELDNDDDSNIEYLFTSYILLLYLTVEKLHTIFKTIGISYDFVQENWPVLIEIRKWANFVKHPKGFLFTHHPSYFFEYEKLVEKEKYQILDFDFIKRFYFREDEKKFKQTIIEVANKKNIAVELPDPERMTNEFVEVCKAFCEKIKLNEHFKSILKNKVIIDE